MGDHISRLIATPPFQKAMGLRRNPAGKPARAEDRSLTRTRLAAGLAEPAHTKRASLVGQVGEA